jgi:hypothetical protein
MLSEDVRTLRRELEAASDRILLQQRELDRLRALQSESRAEHHVQLESASRAQAAAEARAARAEAQLRVAEQKVDSAEREAKDAWQAQDRHVNVVKEVRAQVAQRMEALVVALQEKEEELHRLQYQLRERQRDRDRVIQLEKMVHAREEALTELTGRWSNLRADHDSLVIQHAAARSQSVAAQTAAAAAAASSSTPAGSRMRGSSLAPSEAPPPPPPPADDPHLRETAHVVLQCREWVQETDKAIVGLEDVVEGQYDSLQDLRLVLERGAANINTDSLGSAAAHVDRQRLTLLRRTEQRRLEQQMAAVTDTASSAAIIRTVMANAKFNFEKVRDTLSRVTAYITELRQLADRHCIHAGVSAMSAKFDAWLKARPEPLPLPSFHPPPNQQQHPPTPPALQHTAPSSPLVAQPTSPVVVMPSAAQTQLYEQQIDDLTRRLKGAMEQADEAYRKLREERLQHDADMERLRGEHRVALDAASHEAKKQQQQLQHALELMRDDMQRTMLEQQRELAETRTRHAAELQEREQERRHIVADLESRQAVLERELQEALSARYRDEAALDQLKEKKREMKMSIIEARNEAERLQRQVAELVQEVDESHAHIAHLEREKESLQGVLDFEVQQNETQMQMGAGFRQWQHGASVAAAAAEAARAGKKHRAAGFVAEGMGSGGALPYRPTPSASGAPVMFQRPVNQPRGPQPRHPSVAGMPTPPTAAFR